MGDRGEPRPILGPMWTLVQEAARAWHRDVITISRIIKVADRAYGLRLTEQEARAIRAAAKEMAK